MALEYSNFSPAAVTFFGGDFSVMLAQRPPGTTIISASIAVAIALAVGDANTPPALTLVGSPFLYNSTVVGQQIEGGVPGAVYTIQFSAPLSNGETLVGTVDLPISTKVPPDPQL